MARRKMRRGKRPDYAWMAIPILDSWTYEDTFPNELRGAEVQLCEFSDVGFDETLLQEERSDWVLERALLWLMPTFFAADGGLQAPFEQFMTCRLGTYDPNVLSGQTALSGTFEVLTEWAHVLWEDQAWAYQRRPFVFDTQLLGIAADSVTADARAFATPGIFPLVADIHPKIRLREDTVLGLSYGPTLLNDSNLEGAVFAVQGAAKLLWRKST